MDKTKEGWKQRREVEMAGVVGSGEGKGRKLYFNKNKIRKKYTGLPQSTTYYQLLIHVYKVLLRHSPILHAEPHCIHLFHLQLVFCSH